VQDQSKNLQTVCDEASKRYAADGYPWPILSQ